MGDNGKCHSSSKRRPFARLAMRERHRVRSVASAHEIVCERVAQIRNWGFFRDANPAEIVALGRLQLRTTDQFGELKSEKEDIGGFVDSPQLCGGVNPARRRDWSRPPQLNKNEC